MLVFVSYSFEDENKFQNVAYALKIEGIEYWKSQEITAGHSLRDRLRAAIQSVPVCVLIATQRSLTSEWCLAEIGAFWGAGKPVIVYLAGDGLEETDVPKQFQGDKFATNIPEVVEAVRDHLHNAKGTSTAEAVFRLAIEAFLAKLELKFATN